MEKYIARGKLIFRIDGIKHALLPFSSGDDFFIIFADATSGEETYAAGRYLYANKADGKNRVILDFNKAYNPPCAFSPYATCPLPPRNNILSIKIEAGEKAVHLY